MFTDGPRTITAAAELIRRGELTPSELLEQCLARIDRYESRVKAWVVVDRDGAREQAARLTAELKAGTTRGPLHGIPVGIKDIIDVFDLPTGCGSKLWANSVARQDATCVSRLRQAGAVIVGKTVTTAFAFLDPPPTRNPWNLERTPGGSSSGSAAAVACGMCLGALGTQTGGSVTRPASFCGVCSLKPTHGRISVNGVLPFSGTLDHVGVMANCVRDLAILFQAAAGPDDLDRDALEEPIPDALRNLDLRMGAGPSAVPVGSFNRLGGHFRDRAEPLAWHHLNDAFHKFVSLHPERIDHEVVVPPAGFAELPKWHRLIMAVEAALVHGERLRRHPDDYPPRICALVEEGLAASAVDFRTARLHRDDLEEQVQATLFRRSGTSVFVTPAAPGVAPTPETTGDPAMNFPWSYLGLPTVSVPIAWADGLPLAAQLAGARDNEANLLAVAACFEAAVAFEPRPLPLD
jgi:aspartyl-tRNA(Asn)/glutamyl-tRNA(Gln) amidotransferase subunit A